MKINTKTLFGHKTNVLGRGIPTLMIAFVLLVGAGSAALLSQYGTIDGQAQVEQSVVFVNGEQVTTQEDFSFSPVMAGSTITDFYTLWNRAEVPADASFADYYNHESPKNWTGEEQGIDTTYYLLDGSETFLLDHVSQQGPDVDGELRRSFDTDNDSVVFELDAANLLAGNNREIADGHLVFDAGSDGTMDFQIKYDAHPGDQTPGTPANPQWIIIDNDDNSAYESILDSSDYTVNRDGDTLVIRLESDLTGTTFRYAAGLGTMDDNSQYAGYRYGSGDTAFDWTDSSAMGDDTVIGSQIVEHDPFTLNGDERMSFMVVNDFHVALQPLNYDVQVAVEPELGNNAQ